MIRLVTTVLITLLALTAVAQDCQMIVLFESDGELVDQIVAGVGPLTGHLVLFSDVAEVGGFEASIEITPPGDLSVLGVSGPNGFNNFGDMLNLLAGYDTPLPTSDPTILCTFDFLVGSAGHIVICVNGAEPSQFGEGAPGVTGPYGTLYPCEGGCSEINPTVGTELQSWSAIKGVFGTR
jgi:hypothetical protein